MQRRIVDKPIPTRMVFRILSGTLLAFVLFTMVSYFMGYRRERRIYTSKEHESCVFDSGIEKEIDNKLQVEGL